jgi:hypothetical protein
VVAAGEAEEAVLAGWPVLRQKWKLIFSAISTAEAPSEA